MKGKEILGNRRDGNIDERKRHCVDQRGVVWKKRQLGIVPVAGRSAWRRQGLEQTSSLASGVSRRGEEFGGPVPLVWGRRPREGPVVRVYASGYAQSWEQKSPPCWSVHHLFGPSGPLI